MDNSKQGKNGKRRWNHSRKENAHADSSHVSQRRGFEPRVKMPSFEPVECSFCGKPVTDFASALAHTDSGEPVHFDCVLAFLSEREQLSEGQSIAYIGQGRFAVVRMQNPSNAARFSIERIIEWESRDKKYEWRSVIADVYTCIK
ncbi:hypothetical protein V1L52_03610 [Treponema sp. HNW]|uniref:hypothetical protein n=1 Tax=Treponema sp. HNW TaxID=3116654 RepID=UPI003D12BF33